MGANTGQSGAGTGPGDPKQTAAYWKAVQADLTKQAKAKPTGKQK